MHSMRNPEVDPHKPMMKKNPMTLILAGLLGIALPTMGAPIVIDDDGDRDGLAGPDVTTVALSGHDNGPWGAGTQYFNQTAAYNGGGPTFDTNTPGDASATYTFTTALGVVAGTTYNVYATWAQDGQGNTGPATYTVSDGLGDVGVDHKLAVAPDLLITDPFVGDEKKFQLLGQITEDGDGVITVVLSSTAANFIVVDAVAIAPPSELLGRNRCRWRCQWRRRHLGCWDDRQLGQCSDRRCRCHLESGRRCCFRWDCRRDRDSGGAD